ncbi:MAG: MFS transporter [Opitutaceae bacterium]|jgi:LPLT family lysophospholipid transporter-like MFS transporter
MKPNRNYPLLLAGQFLGAFGDNFLLAAILGPLTFRLTEGAVTEQYVNAQNALFSGVFFIPFIALAPLAGFLNDRMPKTAWLTGGNLLKLLGIGIGFVGIWVHGGVFETSRLWQVIGYAVVGIGACMYSPAKYGILPEILPTERLVKANGTVEMLTLVAILGGLGGGAVIYDRTRSMTACYLASMGLYAAALIANSLMSATPFNPSATLRRSIAEFGLSLRTLITHPRLKKVLLGCAVFWFAGSALRNNLQGWGIEAFQQAGVPNISNEKLALPKVGLVLGIVAGSMAAGQLHKVGELGWTRRYGFLLAAGVLILGLLCGRLGIAAIVPVLIGTGIVAGLLIVPLNAALQHESDPSRLGKTVAIQNFTDYLAMLAGAAFLGLCTKIGLNPANVFVALAATVAALALAMRIAPETKTHA